MIKLRRLALGLLRKAKGKQTVPTTVFQAVLSPEWQTAVIEKVSRRMFGA